jgi:hypothetical protein
VVTDERAPVDDQVAAFDPRSAAELASCRAERLQLTAALAGIAERSAPPVSSSPRVGGGHPSWQSTNGDDLAVVEVETGRPHVQVLGDGSEIRVYGEIHNRQLELATGVLRVVLVNQRGGAVDQSLIPMTLESGITSYDVIFSDLARDMYTARLYWDPDDTAQD